MELSLFNLTVFVQGPLWHIMTQILILIIRKYFHWGYLALFGTFVKGTLAKSTKVNTFWTFQLQKWGLLKLQFLNFLTG